MSHAPSRLPENRHVSYFLISCQLCYKESSLHKHFRISLNGAPTQLGRQFMYEHGLKASLRASPPMEPQIVLKGQQ